jgi:hypothetical protein
MCKEKQNERLPKKQQKPLDEQNDKALEIPLQDKSHVIVARSFQICLYGVNIRRVKEHGY